MTNPSGATSLVNTGGYSSWNFTISPEAAATFKAAKQLGVDYTPLAFATQVVAGLNYVFLCKAVAVSPKAPQRAVKVYIYQPLPGQGDPHITQILDVPPAPSH
jgi:hypothetical protein